MPETPSPVAVALLYQTSQFGGHLRDALKELGAAVVYEALTADIDRDKLEGSGARVVIINLDPDNEAHIEHVYDLLDEGDYQVVFNEAQVSANLSGWDHARWARNLAAKVLKQPGIAEPPRPPGAEAVPTPVQKSASIVPVAGKPGEHAAAVAPTPLKRVPVKPAPVVPARAAVPPIAATPSAPTMAASSELPTLEIPLPELVPEPLPQTADLDAGLDISALGEFAAPGAPTAPEPVPASAVAIGTTSDFAAELDALFAAADAAKPTTTETDYSLPIDFDLVDEPSDVGGDSGQGLESIDIPYDLAATEEPPAARIAAKDQVAAVHAQFPAIFDRLDAAAAAIPEAVDGTFKPGQRTPAPGAENAEPLLPPEWNLDPFHDETAAATPAAPQSAFGIEKVTATDYLAPVVEAPTAKQAPAIPAGAGLSLELMPMEEAIAPSYENPKYSREAWLDGSRPAGTLKVGTGTGIARVFVLGASIGGPEAVRDFLDGLPVGFPALFVLAQHMGEEFLELMSAQLAKAVALTVRSPTHGERVSHGEILVVPTTHRLKVDTEGVVTLAHLPEKAPYSPSIDQVLRDVADQFGSKAGAIIFSGMAHDAIEGSQYLKSKGGIIWAQDPDTCVVSSMVDGAREAGVVSFIGSPQQLAQKMIADFGNG